MFQVIGPVKKFLTPNTGQTRPSSGHGKHLGSEAAVFSISPILIPSSKINKSLEERESKQIQHAMKKQCGDRLERMRSRYLMLEEKGRTVPTPVPDLRATKGTADLPSPKTERISSVILNHQICGNLLSSHGEQMLHFDAHQNPWLLLRSIS